MAYVEVDVDLDDFETYELADELLKRFKAVGKRKLKPEQIAELKEAMEEIAPMLGLKFFNFKDACTLEGKMKTEVIAEAWDKYTSVQLEQRLK